MKILLSKINYNRREEFLIQTNIIQDQERLYVEKRALGDRAWEILSNTEVFYLKLSKKTLKGIRLSKFLGKDIKQKSIRYEFIKGETIQLKIERAFIERDFKTAKKLFMLSNNLIDNFTTKLKKKELRDFEIFTEDYYLKIPSGVLKQFTLLTELSRDHMIISDKDGIPTLIDYENFLGFALPTKFIKFRAEIYLLLALQQVIRSLGSQYFILKTYWKNLFIPKEWQKINNFTLEEKKFFLYLEEKLQNYLYKNKSNIERLNLLDYQEIETNTRMYHKITVESQIQLQQANNKLSSLQNSKLYKAWKLYHRIKDAISRPQ